MSNDSPTYDPDRPHIRGCARKVLEILALLPSTHLGLTANGILRRTPEALQMSSLKMLSRVIARYARRGCIASRLSGPNSRRRVYSITDKGRQTLTDAGNGLTMHARTTRSASRPAATRRRASTPSRAPTPTTVVSQSPLQTSAPLVPVPGVYATTTVLSARPVVFVMTPRTHLVEPAVEPQAVDASIRSVVAACEYQAGDRVWLKSKPDAIEHPFVVIGHTIVVSGRNVAVNLVVREHGSTRILDAKIEDCTRAV